MAAEEMVNELSSKIQELLSIWNFKHVEETSKIKYFEEGDESRMLDESSVYCIPTMYETKWL